jgi:type IV pilus assembly protein PilA
MASARFRLRVPNVVGTDADGFTLIELLVVILIIGVLAAIAIPSLLNQQGKAKDASAKELARAASQAAETYSTDHEGNYGGMTLELLKEYEPALVLCKGKTAAEVAGACLASVKLLEENRGYEVTSESITGDKFTWRKPKAGEVSRVCEAPAEPKLCPTGSW